MSQDSSSPPDAPEATPPASPAALVPLAPQVPQAPLAGRLARRQETAGRVVAMSPEENEAQKLAIYEKMSPRRRKWIDKIGFDKWEPFAPPKDPLDIRKDATQRTPQELATLFLRDRPDAKGYGETYASGAMEMAVGLLRRDARYIGMYEYSHWYQRLLEKEGKTYED